MKIIRALWGSQSSTRLEIPETPIFDNEIVYVWGEENRQFLEKRGYETIAVSEEETEISYSNIFDHFAHKLDVFVLAEKHHGEFLFLDWDVKKVKELDEKFWKLLRSKPLQCPIYGYPGDYSKKINQHFSENSETSWVKALDANIPDWLQKQEEMLEKYHWKLEDLQVVPNAAFFYSNYTGIMKDLRDIYHREGIKTCIEEFVMHFWANCTLERYIEEHEPYVIRGRENDCYHFGYRKEEVMQKINSYVDSKIKKEIYLVHA
jgi:hypothetical protein